MTTEEYWDCECDFVYGYIWPKAIEECPRCGARAEDQPDARIEEAGDHALHGKPITEDE